MATAARRLRAARRKRRHAAAALDALKNGRVTLEHVLAHPPPSLAHVTVYVIICKTPRMGPTGAKKCLTTCNVWPETRLGSLSRQERELILKELPPRARYRDVS